MVTYFSHERAVRGGSMKLWTIRFRFTSLHCPSTSVLRISHTYTCRNTCISTPHLEFPDFVNECWIPTIYANICWHSHRQSAWISYAEWQGNSSAKCIHNLIYLMPTPKTISGFAIPVFPPRFTHAKNFTPWSTCAVVLCGHPLMLLSKFRGRFS